MSSIHQRGWRSRWTLIASLLGVTLLVVGCAPTPTNRDGGATSPSSGGQSTTPSAPKILKLGMQASNEPSSDAGGPASPAPWGNSGSGSASLDHFFTFHASLTMFDPSGQVVPLVAQKVPSLSDGDWKLTPDGGMEVTWKVRPNVKWHDGATLTAEDFAFGFQVVKNPQLPVASPRNLPNITELKVIDPNTFVVTCDTHTVLGNYSNYDGIPALPRHLFADIYATGDRAAFENSPLWSTQWVGLGPYRLVDWQLGSQIEAAAFDGYFQGKPKVDRIIIRYIGDANALVANMLSGDIDVIPLGGQLDLPQMVAIRDAWAGSGGGLTMPIPKGVRTAYIQFRDPTTPWASDVRVRQALTHAMSRPEIVDNLLYGLTDVAEYFAGPEEPAYKLAKQRNVPAYPYDLAQAERLMADAGWTRGADRLFRNSAGQNVNIDVTSSNSGANVQESSTVAAQWSAAGFVSKPTPYPARAENAAEIRHNSPGALIWPYNFNPTVIRTFTQGEIGRPNNRWRGGNYGGYVSPTYEDLYSKLTNTFEMQERSEITFQLLKIIADEVVAIPIFFTPLCLVARKGVEGPGMVSAMQAGNAWNIHTWDVK